MRRIVLDCSVTMAWCFEDESSDYAEATLDLLESGQAVVPSIWPLEVANVLLVSERRRRLSTADTARFVSLLTALPIIVDTSTADRALDEIVSLARSHKLSSYDAAYLELGMREGVEISTLDVRLREAAQAAGVSVFRPE